MLTIAFVICAVQALVLASPFPQEQGGMRIALSKRQISSGDIVDIETLKPVVPEAEAKYANSFAAYRRNIGEPHPLDSRPFDILPDFNLTRRATGAVTLTDEKNGRLWQGAISVGTPPVSYTVDFDTGSSDLFLPGPKCKANYCKGHQKYNPAASSTAVDIRRTFTLRYGDGSTVSGGQYYDTVSIAGLTATQQALGAATTYSSGFGISLFPPDGLLGMGYQSISVYNSPPPFSSLVSQGKTTLPVFSFKLATTGSELYVGGADNTLYTGSFSYSPVSPRAYWQIPLQAVTANNVVSVRNIQSVIDTGTTLIIGSPASVKAFYASIPGAQDATSTFYPGYYTFPCASTPVVSFTFGGRAFNIAPSLFNLGKVKAKSNQCVGAVVASSQFSFWIIGDVFLQNVYTQFDMGNNVVGFASLT